MILRFIIFLTIVFSIIFFGHFLIYKTQIKFLDIQNIASKRYLIMFYSLIFGLLFVSMFATRAANNWFVNSMYYVSILWLPILMYLFLFSSATWIIFGISKIINFQINFKILYYVFLSLVVLITIFGMFTYYNIKHEIVTIEIKNLPEKWKHKKVLLISDIHIGNFRDDKFIANFVEILNKQNADIIFICGDLFDGTKLEIENTANQLNKLKANQKIYFVYGNHETFSHQESVDKIIAKTKFIVLNNQIDTIDGVNIMGINHTALHNDSVIKMLAAKNSNNNPTIFLCHEPMKNIDNLKLLNIDLQLSGHTHAGQFFPINLITKAIYGKMNYGYADFGDFKQFTSSGLGVWGPPLRIMSQSEFVDIKFVD